PQGTSWSTNFFPPMMTVCPALWPPAYRATTEKRPERTSTILPLPSSPHWAPRTTAVFARISTHFHLFPPPHMRRPPAIRGISIVLVFDCVGGVVPPQIAFRRVVGWRPTFAALANKNPILRSGSVKVESRAAPPHICKNRNDIDAGTAGSGNRCAGRGQARPGTQDNFGLVGNEAGTVPVGSCGYR